MPVAVAIMDRDSFGANTDLVVVAIPDEGTLLWVPRDLWCEGIGRRINRAFAHGGHDGLRAALAEHGVGIEHSVCLTPSAVEAGLGGVSVTVPVPQRLEFWYPLDPLRPIEEGRTRISFDPPAQTLSGERIHQWIGARYHVDGRHSDLDRIERQKVLVAALLAQGIDFRRFVAPRLPVRISAPEAVEHLAGAGSAWRFATLSGLIEDEIDGMQVLRRESPFDPVQSGVARDRPPRRIDPR